MSKKTFALLGIVLVGTLCALIVSTQNNEYRFAQSISPQNSFNLAALGNLGQPSTLGGQNNNLLSLLMLLQSQKNPSAQIPSNSNNNTNINNNNQGHNNLALLTALMNRGQGAEGSNINSLLPLLLLNNNNNNNNAGDNNLNNIALLLSLMRNNGRGGEQAEPAEPAEPVEPAEQPEPVEAAEPIEPVEVAEAPEANGRGNTNSLLGYHLLNNRNSGANNLLGHFNIYQGLNNQVGQGGEPAEKPEVIHRPPQIPTRQLPTWATLIQNRYNNNGQ
jgi:hypothetical protein